MTKYTVHLVPLDEEREVEVVANSSKDAIVRAELKNPGYYAGDVYLATEKRRI